MKYKLPIEIESLNDGRFLAKCLLIQGCHAEGTTIPEDIDNLEDIARQLLELRIEDGFPLPEELLEYREDVNEVLKAETVLSIKGHPGILCVDDEEAMYLLCEEELGEEGYIIHFAISGEEALKIFDLAMHLGKPQIDLVILDINMPGMDGLQVLDQIKQKRPNLPVIIYSAYLEDKGSFCRYDDWIVKSHNFDELKASVRRHLRK